MCTEKSEVRDSIAVRGLEIRGQRQVPKNHIQCVCARSSGDAKEELTLSGKKKEGYSGSRVKKKFISLKCTKKSHEFSNLLLT